MNSRCTKEAKSAEFIGQRKGDCRDDFQVSGLATWVGVVLFAKRKKLRRKES